MTMKRGKARDYGKQVNLEMQVLYSLEDSLMTRKPVEWMTIKENENWDTEKGRDF